MTVTQFYVYTHIRDDTGEIFYVGKGCHKRAWSKHRRNPHWLNVSLKGYSVNIIKTFSAELEAFELEAKLINELRESGIHLTNYRSELGNGNFKHCEETIKKFKQRVGAKNPFYNRSHNVDTKEANRLAHSHLQKKVQCVETNQIFYSLGEASRAINADKSNLTRSCVTGIKTAGYHWRFI